MALTPAQLATLKADIANDPVLSLLPNNGDTAITIAQAYNLAASPDYFVLRTSLGKHELTDEAGVGDDGSTPTAFVWGGSTGGYINRSQGERDAWRELFNSSLSCKPNLANVRTAIDDIFSGAGAGAQANRAHFRAKSRRLASRFERLFVVATVGGPAQSGNRGVRTNPDTMAVEGPVSASDVEIARALP